MCILSSIAFHLSQCHFFLGLLILIFFVMEFSKLRRQKYGKEWWYCVWKGILNNSNWQNDAGSWTCSLYETHICTSNEGPSYTISKGFKPSFKTFWSQNALEGGNYTCDHGFKVFYFTFNWYRYRQRYYKGQSRFKNPNTNAKVRGAEIRSFEGEKGKLVIYLTVLLSNLNSNILVYNLLKKYSWPSFHYL